EMLEQGASEEELRRMKNVNLAGFLRGAERLGGFGGRSDILAESMTYGGTPDYYLQRLEAMANATPADVRAAANRWLRAHHYTMTVKPFPRLAAGKSDVDRKILPALDAPPDVKFPAPQRAKLKNGLNVLLLERHATPIVNVALALDAGSSSDTPDKAGVATLALDLMDEGTKTRDAFQIEKELDLLGANLFTGSALDMSFVRLQATTENLRPSLAVMADVVLNPSFPADKFLIQKQRRIAQIGLEKANPNALVQRILPGIIYGANHAYGKPSSGFEKTVETISREDLMKWHADWFKPGSATVVVTGDTTLDKVLPVLEETLGGWQQGTAPRKNLGTVARTPGKKIYLIDKPNAPQSTIVAAHVSETSGQPEDLALEPVMQNFGGMATSRLNRNLRLDKHWSYGASGQLTSVRGQRTFVVVAPVQTDKTKESILEVTKEINDVAGTRPIGGEEFNSIMRNMTSRLAGRFETISALEAAAIAQINFNLPADYWTNYSKNLRALGESQLNAAAKKFVRPHELVWIVVGDLSKIETGIRELNIGEVVRLDADGNQVSR
ncbi:MAG TPA: insulinase family protein, partial [Pyrinomonadaceae bacterium]|nr:insulinase family protein [Pyrinomonadaceae bacterium]